MFIDINKPIITSKQEIQRAHAYYRKATEEHLVDNPNDFYKVDRAYALGYFGIFPKWKEKMFKFFSELKKRNKKFSYVDVCGRASGCRNFGASKSYLFSLKTSPITRTFADKNDVFIDGSIFDSRDFSRMIRLIKRGRIRPAFITFMPMAGLQSYTPISKIPDIPNYEAITYFVLAKRLKQLIEVLQPGGFIMSERPFQFDGSLVEAFQRIPQNKNKLSMVLKKFARKMKCKIEIVSDIGGPYFLIQKPL